MSVAERDNYTGHLTTGHEWNGIKELNTPVPRIIYFCLSAAFLFALGYWYLMPSWPLGDRFYPGKLEIDQRSTLTQELDAARLEKSEWTEWLENADFEQIQSKPDIMSIVDESGPRLFQDNCAMCHGLRGRGQPPFPNLSDRSWLWGGTPDAIMETLRVGINSEHPDSRISNMPALGKSGTLNGEAVAGVVTYLRSLQDPTIGDGRRLEEQLAVKLGKQTYTTICIACHGADMTGNPAMGAPNLADSFWMYGKDEKSLFNSVQNGRAGHMPAWETRLSLADRKILTQYVLGLQL